MKKIFLGFIAAATLMTACDPVCDDKSLELTDYTSNDIANCVSFKVYKDEACTEEAGVAEGNYVKYTTSPATTITVLNKLSDGSDNILAMGPSGTFKLSPKRGSSTDQVLTCRVVNTDNSVAECEKTVSVWVKSDLDPELKLLLGNAGDKKWGWNEDGNGCWGNGGNTGNGGACTVAAIDGKWWGVTKSTDLIEAEDGSNQLQHAAGDEANAKLYAAAGSYMEFDEDGNIKACTADGTEIASSSYTLSDYDAARPSGWALATLETKKPCVLWPYSINEGGVQVTKFDVMHLDENHMTLVYTKGAAAGGWGEITWWRFKNISPSTDILESATIGAREWTWNLDGNGCWGNAGNAGNGAGFTATTVDGKWWGVTSAAELVDQMAHSGDGNTADADNGAYMVFSEGSVTSYGSDGARIRGGKYTLNINADGRGAANWALGTLETSEAALLFPWSINEGGVPVTLFDVMYMDGDNMTLVYTKGNGAGSWGEITWWRFAAK